MRIALGSDHRGYELKSAIAAHLEQQGYEVIDCGCDSPASVDYPQQALRVAKLVQAGQCVRGILVCGTGIGISIAANKVHGVRCSLCLDVLSAQYARSHNDANVLALGQDVVGRGFALQIVDAWLATEFEGGRHQRRVDMISAIEQQEK